MISFLKKSIVATTVLASAPLASATVYAADEDSSHRGTMGAGYENYLKEHPTATQNNSVTRERLGITNLKSLQKGCTVIKSQFF